MRYPNTVRPVNNYESVFVVLANGSVVVGEYTENPQTEHYPSEVFVAGMNGTRLVEWQDVIQWDFTEESV